MNPSDVPPGPLLVDTDVFSFVTWGRDRYQDFVPLMQGHLLVLSFATVAELRYGALHAAGAWPPARHQKLEKNIRRHVVISATDAVTRKWAELFVKFRHQLRGDDRGWHDMWTAACALAQPTPTPVVTNNRADFERIATQFPLIVIHPDA